MSDPCAAESPKARSSIFRGDSYALKFAVEWKEGMQLRPALLSPVASQCIGYSRISSPDGDLRIPAVTCQMTVASKGVPLANHLIVSIFTADGKRLTRLSAAP